MSTFKYRSYNKFGSTLYTAETEIVTSKDADSFSYERISTTTGGATKAVFDMSKVVTAHSGSLGSPGNDLFVDDAFIMTVDWGSSGQYTSTILFIGDYNDFLNDFAGVSTMIVLGGDNPGGINDAVKLYETATNFRSPVSPFQPDREISFQDAVSFLSYTENDKMVGGSEDEAFYSGVGNDTIDAGGGNDTVHAGSGADEVYLGDGNDYAKVGGGKEHFDGGSGWDYISYYDSTGGVTVNLAANKVSGSWAVNDTIKSFEGVSGSKTGGDTIYGTGGGNTIRTYGGNDKVYAGNGSDKVYLGDGNDYVLVGGGKEHFDGGSGYDYISYYDSSGGVRIDLGGNTVSGSWAVNDTINSFEGASGSNTGADTLLGTSGGNRLMGWGGNDRFYGRGGNDKLYGGAGRDFFDGGTGTDLLYGGADADTFHFDKGEGHDIIKDFRNNIDMIQLDNFAFAPGRDAFDFATQVGEDVVFDFGRGDMLTVENATIGQLDNDLDIV